MEFQRRRIHKERGVVISGLILLTALTRLFPHPPNFTPISAIALFGGATLPLRQALLVTLGSMGVSDLLLGFLAGDWSMTLHPTLPAVYGSLIVTVLLSHRFLRSRLYLSRIIGVMAGSSLLFFFVTNFAVWLLTDLYPKTWQGLILCYVAALPFFRNSVLGDVVYTGLLFGAYGLVGLLGRRSRQLSENGVPDTRQFSSLSQN